MLASLGATAARLDDPLPNDVFEQAIRATGLGVMTIDDLPAPDRVANDTVLEAVSRPPASSEIPTMRHSGPDLASVMCGAPEPPRAFRDR